MLINLSHTHRIRDKWKGSKLWESLKLQSICWSPTKYLILSMKTPNEDISALPWVHRSQRAQCTQHTSHRTCQHSICITNFFFSQDSDGLSWSISVTFLLRPSCPTENKHQQTAQILNVGDCGLSSTSRLCCQVMDELLFLRTMKIELIKTFDQHQSIKQTLSQKFN